VPWNDPAVAGALAIAWDYMRLVHAPQPADVILTLGSFDTNAAVHTARLWGAGLAPVMIMSGGIAHRGGLLDTGWDRSEARVFADIARREGVPEEAILLEEQALNTGDNFSFGRDVARKAGLDPKRVIVVAKPYMTRRGFATGRVKWPDVELLMQCEDIAMADYFARESDPERTLLALVGDLHRILIYPALGFSIEQEMPPAVEEALQALAAAGYGARLVPGEPISRRGSPPRRP
jgi:uncharacterized SAM-binding protein YcdF (DUF218 family)